MNELLSLYPLTQIQKSTLESKLGVLHYRSVSELSKKGIPAVLKTLWWPLKKNTYLYLDSDTQERFLPNLLWFGLVSLSRHLWVVRSHNPPQRLSRIAYGIRLPLQFLKASVKGCVAMARTAWRLRTPPTACHYPLPAFQPDQRIAYLNANFWFGLKAGGAISHALGIIRELLEKGYEVDVFGFTQLELEHPRLHLIRPHFPSLFGLPIESNYYVFSEQLYTQLKQHYQQQPPTAIYQRLSFANDAGVRLAHHFRIPVVLEYNGSEVWVNQQWGRPLRFLELGSRMERHILQQAQVVITVSEVLKQQLLSWGLTPQQVVMHPNGVDPEQFTPLVYSHEQRAQFRAPYGIEANATVLSFVGTFGVWHGVELLADVIEQLLTQHSAWLRQHRVVFLWVGDGQLAPRLRERFAHAEAQPHVRFIGLIPPTSVPLALAASDILLSPHIPNADQSAFFGSPTKIFEYMAMAKPIIASRLEQVGEVLQPSLNEGHDSAAVSLLCPPGDASALLKAIVQLVEHPQLWETLGRNARQKVLNHYTWAQHVSAFWHTLEGSSCSSN